MNDILSLSLLLGIIGLISFLITKLIIWSVPRKSKNKNNINIITFAISFLLLSVSAFFYLSKMVFMSPSGNRKDIVDRLVQGRIAYHIPDTMDVGNTYKAVATVSKSESDKILFQNIDRSGFKAEVIKISSRVKMVLIDPTEDKNFKITPLNTEEQLVYNSTNSIWKWNIIPVRSGENELILRTTVKVLDELGENLKDIPVFEKKITVNASMSFITKQFIGDYWQWLSTTIIIPFILFVYHRINKKKRSNRKIGF